MAQSFGGSALLLSRVRVDWLGEAAAGALEQLTTSCSERVGFAPTPANPLPLKSGEEALMKLPRYVYEGGKFGPEKVGSSPFIGLGSRVLSSSVYSPPPPPVFPLCRCQHSSAVCKCRCLRPQHVPCFVSHTTQSLIPNNVFILSLLIVGLAPTMLSALPRASCMRACCRAAETRPTWRPPRGHFFPVPGYPRVKVWPPPPWRRPGRRRGGG